MRSKLETPEQRIQRVVSEEVAREYEAMKIRSASILSQDRVAYTQSKTEFIGRVTSNAKL